MNSWVASVHKKYGFVDRHGKQVIPFQYDFTWDFSEGMGACLGRISSRMHQANGSSDHPIRFRVPVSSTADWRGSSE
jgi:WG repeat protein